MYLGNGGEPSPYGGSSPFYFVSRRRVMVNFNNIRIFILLIENIDAHIGKIMPELIIITI